MPTPAIALQTFRAPTFDTPRVAMGAPICLIAIESTSTSDQVNVPVTMGHVFLAGDVSPADGLVARVDGLGELPLQFDVKATHPDGSVRHGVISGVIPMLKAGVKMSAALVRGKQVPANPASMRLGFSTEVRATIEGVTYSVAVDDLLRVGGAQTWLNGPVATEWQVPASLKTAEGVAHPHLAAIFGIRWYEGANKARIDVSIENDWAFEPGPQNFTYDAEIIVGGNSVYSQKALTHFHHTRWRKVFWLDGQEPGVHVKQDTAYVISTGMVPNYDQTVKVTESAIAGFYDGWKKSPRAPMNTGQVSPYMPMTGGRPDIGILPAWSVMYLLSQDRRAKEVMLGNADLAGSFSSHYRDRNTGRPVTLASYPYMTILGREGDTMNFSTGKKENFPYVPDSSKTPNTHDASHQPSLAYFPYLVTGDKFYLDELHFWANWNLFSTNPNYRGNVNGLFNSDQVRGQAWSLRTLGEAAAITPDDHPDKAAFNFWLDKNLDDYISRYVGDKNNSLGVIVDGSAYSYRGETAIAPWQDDFFTAAIGHLIELGYPKAANLMQWKGKFVVARMTDPGYCFVDAATYDMKIRDAKGSPVYKTFAEAYAATVDPKLVELKCNSAEQLAYRNANRPREEAAPFKQNDIINLAFSPIGYPSNLQPALAMAADAGLPMAKEAWERFDSRPTKPDYSGAPQFAIVPRTLKSQPAVTPAPVVYTPPIPAAPAVPNFAVKITSAPSGDGKWKRIAGENEHVKVEPGTMVRYGEARKGYVYGIASGEFDANNNTFQKDPAPGIVKYVERYDAVIGKITSPTCTKLAKLKNLTVSIFDPLKLELVKSYPGVEASTKGVVTVSGEELVKGKAYAATVQNEKGEILMLFFPLSAVNNEK